MQFLYPGNQLILFVSRNELNDIYPLFDIISKLCRVQVHKDQVLKNMFFSGREVFKLKMHTYERYFILKGLRNLGIKKCLVSEGYILTTSF